ncbi:RNA polymerase II-associated protein 3 [Anoplophora glabripennis]|nr:RNA polymerase II-associated protein 3 [Anoplophora glabripennis]
MNPVLLRKQLQENASDLQDFCKDLKSWGEEMKRKEEALKNCDSERTSQENNSDHKKIKKHDKSIKKSKKEVPKKPVTKIGITDYGAWDKFDADAECNKLEDDINEDSELTDECNDNMQDLAIIEKEKGNKFVKSQKWDEAIKCYSRAIQYYSYDPIFYANRALCHLKKSNFEEAERDCTLSIKLDKTYVKAYQRRAAAREVLNKLEHAEFDLSKVLALEPKNKESREALEKLRKKLGKPDNVLDQRPISKFTASRNKSNVSKLPIVPPVTDTTNTDFKNVFDTSKPVSSWLEEDNIILVKPIKKPPHLRSKEPLKRIKIIEKDNSVTESITSVKSEPDAIKQHVFEKQEKSETVKDISTFKEDRCGAKKDVSAFKRRQTEKVSEKSDHSTAFPRPDQPSPSIKSDDFKIIEKKPPDFSSQLSALSKAVKNTSNISISNEHKKAADEKTNTEFVKPKTSVQFNLIWKNLKDTAQKYEYLKQIDPQDFPRIFLNSLESHVFSGILEVLAKHFIENKDPIFDILDSFTQVKRFGTFTMFMSSSDKKNLWKIFDYVKEVEQKNKEDVDRLIEKYEL